MQKKTTIWRYISYWTWLFFPCDDSFPRVKILHLMFWGSTSLIENGPESWENHFFKMGLRKRPLRGLMLPSFFRTNFVSKQTKNTYRDCDAKRHTSITVTVTSFSVVFFGKRKFTGDSKWVTKKTLKTFHWILVVSYGSSQWFSVIPT